MKIISLKIFNSATGWTLEKTDFLDLTLLVGGSGVGKTKIEESIVILKAIAEDAADENDINGFSWWLEFEIDGTKSDVYTWEGSFEKKEIDPVHSYYRGYLKKFNGGAQEEKNKILNESLKLNGKTIFLREEDNIDYNGQRIVKLSPYTSLMKALQEEKDVGEVFRSLLKIRGLSWQECSSTLFPLAENKKSNSLEELKSSNYSPLKKLEIVFSEHAESFNEIKDRFINIFPRVEDVRFQKNELPDFRPVLQIKEVGVEQWISVWDMSKGMIKTLIQLCNVFLSSKGSVILIDEVENSLGVNCMEAVFEEIMSADDVQFIITSHHPYIINNIGPENWKIVKRKGSIVSVKSPESIGLNHSRHDLFLQLTNSQDFQEL